MTFYQAGNLLVLKVSVYKWELLLAFFGKLTGVDFEYLFLFPPFFIIIVEISAATYTAAQQKTTVPSLFCS